jgi:CheY-like chemotaxis protein
MLREMLGLLRTTLGAAVEVRVAAGPSTWPAMIDRNQAEMAILNLVVNARDAMARGGTITISTGNVHLRHADPTLPELSPGEYVVVSVRDSGTGMSEEVARRAFEPFFTTKEAGKGSGLGLAQVHGFAAQSGGAAEIHSFPGAGTTVKLYLPKAGEAPAASREAPARAANDGPRQTVLLVDDDGLVRKGVAGCLLSLGHAVLEASSAEEALDTLALRKDVTLLLTDYMMPGMRGTQLARLAQRTRPGVPVLLITGSADLPETEVAQWDVLRKPFTAEELSVRLTALARGLPRLALRAC